MASNGSKLLQRLKAHAVAADCHLGMRNAVHKGEGRGGIPSKGDRIELLRTRMGIRLTGTVYYSDQLQILVKWDDGSSQNLRVGLDRYRILE
jgi:hypothetical protein